MKNLIKAFKQGKPVIVFDIESRENEADLIIPIEKCTPESVNFLITHGKGLLCAPISEEIMQEKGFPFMPTLCNDHHGTAFTLSVDSKKVKTGISPYERYLTAKDLIDPQKTLKDFITPGHLFPLIAKKGGVLARKGHTEAGITLCTLASLKPAALICEMIKPDGKMYSRKEAENFAEKHNLAYCDIADIVEYQKQQFPNVQKISKSKLKTAYGNFDITVYKELFTDKEHVFLGMGDYKNGPVRIHSECLTGDVFKSLTCDCENQLDAALKIIAKEGRGAIIYLRQEGRNIGLGEKIKAYALQQNQNLDTVEANLKLGHTADNRSYHQSAWILQDQGYKKVKLMTHNPAKIKGLTAHGLKVEKIKLALHIRKENYQYLKTKKEKFGHEIEL
ncbi:3,4-dihydroxy-2-butanone-4-phosphate synthase [bacterium]|jgi:3,4-dihydroxy 2-butanone 4-phosphate synthase / GTP cyclohydrolase II|nr:3,4-dihydroxy-2-butanone-4-phosphate synthase [bacterium]MBT3581565.1 3,4-dihydroxy-2-butanone-4-phosphate synthase [bacterium]MBT4551470.1 3,4-dihydroxy-2-butanone-4-phosphate synthase [bacterium]MBT5988094.1 3,4-dihydroxy-2-butanone-4-phosphate synthase [bacterium]